MSEINIDAEMVAYEASLSRTEEKLVEMSNGCICGKNEKIFRRGSEARKGKYRVPVIESTEISEPLPVAETFTFEDEDGIRHLKWRN